jgi:hypothetical protein
MTLPFDAERVAHDNGARGHRQRSKAHNVVRLANAAGKKKARCARSGPDMDDAL